MCKDVSRARPDFEHNASKAHLVVEACAMMLPPIGFFVSPAPAIGPLSTEATTWLVTTTAIPN